LETLRRSTMALETLDTVYLTNAARILTGTVPLGRLLLTPPSGALMGLRTEQLVFVDTDAQEREVIELFDKYNLRSLPVVDTEQKLVGVITVDDVVHRLWQQQK